MCCFAVSEDSMNGIDQKTDPNGRIEIQRGRGEMLAADKLSYQISPVLMRTLFYLFKY
jgi:hypothetical protein